MTGVFVRDVLFERMNEQIGSAASQYKCLGLLFVDVDHFKKLNDSFGHLAGDHVLRKVGQTIASKVRVNDIVGRFGGEEFAILVPDADMHALHVVAERVRESIEVLKFECGGESISVTVSIGAALIGPLTETRGMRELAITTADVAMYQAKHEGRNRVVVISGDEVPGCKLIRKQIKECTDDSAIKLPHSADA